MPILSDPPLEFPKSASEKIGKNRVGPPPPPQTVLCYIHWDEESLTYTLDATAKHFPSPDVTAKHFHSPDVTAKHFHSPDDLRFFFCRCHRPTLGCWISNRSGPNFL